MVASVAVAVVEAVVREALEASAVAVVVAEAASVAVASAVAVPDGSKHQKKRST